MIDKGKIAVRNVIDNPSWFRDDPQGADIKGYLDPSVIKSDSYLLTTGRTWGCLCFYRNICC